MRRAAKRDAGEAAIVEALRGVGCSVRFWGTNGAPDLVVGFRGQVFLLEVKDPIGTKGGKSRSGQHLNPLQEKWHLGWRGHVAIVRSAFGALEAIGLVKPGGGSADR